MEGARAVELAAREDASPRHADEAHPFGQGVRIEIAVQLDGLQPEDVMLELVMGRHTHEPSQKQTAHFRFEAEGTRTEQGEHRFVLELTPEMCGRLEYRVRLYPYHELLTHPQELGMMLWL
jgi:glycogen phosphorylase